MSAIKNAQPKKLKPESQKIPKHIDDFANELRDFITPGDPYQGFIDIEAIGKG